MATLANHAFVKMNGLGNEIVVADLRRETGVVSAEEARAAAQGVPYDQLMILHAPRARGTDAYVRILNNDGSDPITGTQPGSVAPCLERITTVENSAARIRATIATMSRECSLITRLTGSPPGSGRRPPRRARSGRGRDCPDRECWG